MQTITFTVPDHVEQPGTIADYAFAHAMEQRFGKLVDVVGPIELAEPGDVDTPNWEQFERAAVQVANYLEGVTGTPGTDPFSPLIEYIEVADEDTPTWLSYVSDCRDA